MYTDVFVELELYNWQHYKIRDSGWEGGLSRLVLQVCKRPSVTLEMTMADMLITTRRLREY